MLAGPLRKLALDSRQQFLDMVAQIYWPKLVASARAPRCLKAARGALDPDERWTVLSKCQARHPEEASKLWRPHATYLRLPLAARARQPERHFGGSHFASGKWSSRKRRPLSAGAWLPIGSVSGCQSESEDRTVCSFFVSLTTAPIHAMPIPITARRSSSRGKKEDRYSVVMSEAGRLPGRVSILIPDRNPRR